MAANAKDRFVFEVDDWIVVITKDGGVFVHDVIRSPLPPMSFGRGTPKSVSAPRRINGAVPVAANPQDEHVLLYHGQIVVITRTGGVFGHDLDLSKGTVGPPFQFAPASIKVAANPQDAHVLPWPDKILVVTKSGEIFAHELRGRTVGAPFQLAPASTKVAALPQDKRVLALQARGELAVITTDGSVFGHDLFPAPPVAVN